MSARKMQHHEACKEVSYIQSINPRNPGATFNHDPECFQSYRNMQANHARRSGHERQADQMIMWGPWLPPLGLKTERAA